MSYTYSFVIPHHNNPELLDRCLESIPLRSDIQVIVVDDNSLPTRQPNIFRPGVELIHLDAQQSQGAGHARNVGLKQAQGRWLLFADCDDYYEPNFLDVLDGYTSSETDVVYFSYNTTDEAGTPQDTEDRTQLALKTPPLTQLQSDLVRYKNNCPWNKMVSSSFVYRNNIFFEETPNGNDILFSLRLSLCAKSYLFEPSKLYNYVIHPHSISTRKQSVEDVVCRIEHDLKKFAFNKAIGHPEWRTSLVDILYGLFTSYGVVFGTSVLCKIAHHYLCGTFKPKEWAALVP